MIFVPLSGGSGNSGGNGILPTPSDKFKIDPPVQMRGVFDPFEIASGYVFDAEEVWVNEKAAREAEKQARKRLRRQDVVYHGIEEFINQDSGQFEEDSGPNGRPGFHPPGWREPPEKRRNFQGPSGFHHPDAGPNMRPPMPHRNQGELRPRFPSFRGRHPHPNQGGRNVPDENWPGNEASVLDEEQEFFEEQGELEIGPGGPSGDGPALWEEQPENEHPGFQANRGRGRGRGMMNNSMNRPPFARGGMNSNIRSPFPDQSFGQGAPSDHGMSWRPRGPGHFEDNSEYSDPPNHEQNNEWDGSDYLPGQHHGPRPLLRRGRGAPPGGRGVPPGGRGTSPGGRGAPTGMRGAPPRGRGALPGRRPPSFEGRPPGMSPKGRGFHGNIPSPNDNVVGEDGIGMKNGPKLKGLMDEAISPARKEWRNDNLGQGT